MRIYSIITIFIAMIALSSCDPFEELLLRAQTLADDIGSPPMGSADCEHCRDDIDNSYCPNDALRGKRVTYIGDSHSYLTSKNGSRMGNEIITALKECKVPHFSYSAACGSRPSNWKSGNKTKSTCGVTTYSSNGRFNKQTKGTIDNLPTLVRKNNPETVIINLGDNMFRWKKSGGVVVGSSRDQSYVNSQVHGLLNDVPAGVDCIWVGPAYHSRGKYYDKPKSAVDTFYNRLKVALGTRCQLIDSRPYFNQTAPNDGLHFTNNESKKWGESLARDIKRSY